MILRHKQNIFPSFRESNIFYKSIEIVTLESSDQFVSSDQFDGRY